MQDVASAQRSCPDFQDMFLYLEQEILPNDDVKARKNSFNKRTI